MRSKSWNSLILFGLFFASFKESKPEQVALVKGNVSVPEKKSQDSTPRQRTERSTQENLQTIKTLQNLEKQLSTDDENNLQNQRIISVKPLAKPRSSSSENQQNSIYVGSDYILPYLRPGRNIGASSKETTKRQDSMVPYPRLGRSLPGVESHEDTESLMLPLARFGRSTNADSDDDNDLEGQFITPYPRMGKRGYHNSIFLPFYRLSRSSDFMTPYPRIGKRADSNSLPFNRFGRNDGYLTPYPRLGKRNKEAYLRLAREENSEYMTPYPRLGKRSFTEDIMIPNPRLEKRSSTEGILIPYPRLGKRTSTEDTMVPYPRLGKRLNEETILPYPRIGRGQQWNPVSPRTEASSLYITPYPRLGKRFNEILLSRNMYSKLLDSLSDDATDTLLPHMRMGRSDDIDNANGTIDYDDENPSTMIPNFRFGRSEMRENSHIRRKRSLDFEDENQVLLPYPRLGRASGNRVDVNHDPHNSPNVEDETDKNHNDVPLDSDDSPYMLPYLRPGRSNAPSDTDDSPYMLPYLRPGRSDILPDTNDSPYMLPYLRPGRSDVPSDTDDSPYMLPYLRPGRSDVPSDTDDSPYMIPYLRPGRSDVPSDTDDSPYMLPYLRPGRSDQRSHTNRLNLKHFTEKLSKSHTNHNQDEELASTDYYMLPYLRPGRSYY